MHLKVLIISVIRFLYIDNTYFISYHSRPTTKSHVNNWRTILIHSVMMEIKVTYFQPGIQLLLKKKQKEEEEEEEEEEEVDD